MCPQGLDPGALAAVEEELEPLSGLPCVQSRREGQGGPLATASAVVGAVTAVLASWPPGPARDATERLLGIGPTRTLPRRQRRRAAREILGVGEEHFRKHREGVLLTELASAMLIASQPNPDHDERAPIGDRVAGGVTREPQVVEPEAAAIPAPDAVEPEVPATHQPPRRHLRLRHRLLWVVPAVTLVGAGAGITAAASGGSPPGADHAGPLLRGDYSQFVSENYPNGVTLPPHSHVRKTWRLADAGTVTWRQRWLERQASSGSCRTPERVPVPTTRPGQQVDITVPVTTGGPGVCLATWKMTSRSGVEFFPNEAGVNYLFHIR